MKKINVQKKYNIYYQWNPWSYMNIASLEIKKWLNINIEKIEWKPEFIDVWKKISDNSIWVLAIENSYMWSIHPNLYAFLKYDYKIIWDYFLPINHCLCSKEKDIKDIKNVYSQLPALDQCYNYLRKNNMTPISFSDTALSAKYISESDEKWLWAICSEQAAKIYNLNILQKNIQDQQWNNTRFAIIVPRNSEIKYNSKSNKISILFETKDIPASLYKCLWAFATNDVNLTKIESLPSWWWLFTYYFWLDFNGSLIDSNIKKALDELSFFTSFIKIIGEY